MQYSSAKYGYQEHKLINSMVELSLLPLPYTLTA